MHNVHAFLPSLDIEIASININHQEWDDWTGTLLTFLFLPPPSLLSPHLPPLPCSLLKTLSLSHLLTPVRPGDLIRNWVIMVEQSADYLQQAGSISNEI